MRFLNFLKNPTRSPKVAMTLVDKDITRHLQYQGQIDDEWGLIQTENFVDQFLKSKGSQFLVHQSGFEKNDLMNIYIWGIKSLPENPCIWCGPHGILVSTLIFIEPQRLTELLEHLVNSHTFGTPGFDEVAKTRTSLMAAGIQQTHELHLGSFPFPLLGEGGDPHKFLAYK
jgi:hypothetical protein